MATTHRPRPKLVNSCKTNRSQSAIQSINNVCLHRILVVALEFNCRLTACGFKNNISAARSVKKVGHHCPARTM